MNWIEDSSSYQYLKRFTSQIEPANEDELAFKVSLDWALLMLEEQSRVLLNIERAQNSDISSIPPPSNKPQLTLIQGGKANDFKRTSSKR